MATRDQLVGALLEFSATEAMRGGEHDSVDAATAWRGEVARRVQEIESGAVELEDGSTAMRTLWARAQERLAQRRR